MPSLRSVAAVVMSVLLVAVGASPARAQEGSVAPASVRGVVVDSAGKPVAGAQVRSLDGLRSGTTDTAGVFLLDSLRPGTVSIEIEARGYKLLEFDLAVPPGVVGSIRVTLTSATLPAEPEVPMPPAIDSLAIPAGKAALALLVVDSLNRPIAQASIQLDSLEFATDSAGRATRLDVEPGLKLVRIRKVGFRAEFFTTEFVARQSTSATITLRPAVATLAAVEIRAARRGSQLALGFDDRKKTATGQFVEREEIVRRNPSTLTDLLRGLRNVTVQNGTVLGRPNGNMLSGGSCALPLILDGIIVGDTNLDALLQPQDIAAIEVYNSGPAVPSELQQPRTACGAIVVWTR